MFGTFANSLFNWEGSKRSNGFNWSSTAEQTARDMSLKGKNILITGSNTGIGKEAARVFSKLGAFVILACRNVQRGEEAVADLLKLNPNADLKFMQMDLGSLKSIRSFVDEFNKLNKPLHILLNNAGIMANSDTYSQTEDGFEMQFGTNHLGHFYLTNLLLPKLKEGAPSRVVNIASSGHRMSDIDFDDLTGKTLSAKYGGKWYLYGQSKTANILFTVELNRRMQEEGIGLSVSLHPGSIRTDLGRHLAGSFSGMFFAVISQLLFKTIEQGAATSVYCCTAPEIQQDNLGGKFFSDSNEALPLPYAVNPERAKRLWEESERLVGLQKN